MVWTDKIPKLDSVYETKETREQYDNIMLSKDVLEATLGQADITDESEGSASVKLVHWLRISIK